MIANSNGSGAGSATFERAISGSAPEDPFGSAPLGGCVSLTLSSATNSVVSYLDVGSSVVLSGPSLLTLVRGSTNGEIVYTASPSAGGIAFDSTYSLIVPGAGSNPAATIQDAVIVPPTFVVTSPAGFGSVVSVPTGGLSLTWTPSSPGPMFLLLDDATGHSVQCLYSDHGSFTVPARFLGELGSSGSISLLRIRPREIRYDGHDLLSHGAVRLSATFTKN